jgi:GTP cyclohydrolase I
MKNDQNVELCSAFRSVIQCVDPHFDRQGVEETPARMAKAWREHTAGYAVDPLALLKQFDDGSEGYDEMVVVGGIPFYSRCEHHGEAIFGQATIAYIPDKRIVGLSKLARITDVFAKRLQVQERMTVQIANTIQEGLQPLGVGVRLRARHLCMESRGVCKHGTVTTTTCLLGVIREGEPRQEFLQAAGQYNGHI